MTESEWVCATDNGPPLYNEHAVHPFDMQTELVTRKSPLVIYMMEKRVGETSFRKVLNGLVAAKASSEPKEGKGEGTASHRGPISRVVFEQPRCLHEQYLAAEGG